MSEDNVWSRSRAACTQVWIARSIGGQMFRPQVRKGPTQHASSLFGGFSPRRAPALPSSLAPRRTSAGTRRSSLDVQPQSLEASDELAHQQNDDE
jgi:hypothetical protein